MSKKVEFCPKCGTELHRIEGLCTDRDGIRQDRFCPECNIIFGSRASGLVERLRLVDRYAPTVAGRIRLLAEKILKETNDEESQ